MCLTLWINQTLKLEQCTTEDDIKENQWIFKTIITNPDIIENFLDATLEDIQEVRQEQRKVIICPI